MYNDRENISHGQSEVATTIAAGDVASAKGGASHDGARNNDAQDGVFVNAQDHERDDAQEDGGRAEKGASNNEGSQSVVDKSEELITG